MCGSWRRWRDRGERVAFERAVFFLGTALLFPILCGMASHPRKFINKPTEGGLKKFPPDVRHLIKKGREQRYVTHQEIMSVVPNAEMNVDLLDEIYTLLVDLGIQVIDVKDVLIWEKHGKSALGLPEAAEDLSAMVTAD